MYEMFSTQGDEAVEKWVINPTLEAIDGGPTDKNPHDNIRERAALQVRYGIEHVAAIGHREVYDTAVREAIYGTIGKALRDRGVLLSTDDPFNWDR